MHSLKYFFVLITLKIWFRVCIEKTLKQLDPVHKFHFCHHLSQRHSLQKPQMTESWRCTTPLKFDLFSLKTVFSLLSLF
jgi:hypothetical protein